MEQLLLICAPSISAGITDTSEKGLYYATRNKDSQLVERMQHLLFLSEKDVSSGRSIVNSAACGVRVSNFNGKNIIADVVVGAGAEDVELTSGAPVYLFDLAGKESFEFKKLMLYELMCLSEIHTEPPVYFIIAMDD